MRITDMNWMQVEAQVARDDRCILPIGSTEQHGYLSLGVDLILAERVSVEAAEPLGVPVFPVMPFGIAPGFADYPGSVSLRVETMLAVMRDVILSVRRSGFRRILIVNGHGGNQPVAALAGDLMAAHGDISVKFHGWWNAPDAWAKVQAIDPSGSHANWMENFAWTRLAGVAMPAEPKGPFDRDLLRASPPAGIRAILGDGAFGGDYQKPDAVMDELWRTGVAETRAVLEGPWPDLPPRGAGRP